MRSPTRRWQRLQARDIEQFVLADPSEKIVNRATGLLKRIAPAMARSEALMPDLQIERGLVSGQTYPADAPRVGTVAFFTGCVMNSMLVWTTFRRHWRGRRRGTST